MGLLLCKSIFAVDAFAENVAPILRTLHIGQKVSVTENNGMYKVAILDDGTIGTYQVTDLTNSYLGLIDIVGITTVKIPITSISAVSVTTTKKAH